MKKTFSNKVRQLPLLSRVTSFHSYRVRSSCKNLYNMVRVLFTTPFTACTAYFVFSVFGGALFYQFQINSAHSTFHCSIHLSLSPLPSLFSPLLLPSLSSPLPLSFLWLLCPLQPLRRMRRVATVQGLLGWQTLKRCVHCCLLMRASTVWGYLSLECGYVCMLHM